MNTRPEMRATNRPVIFGLISLCVFAAYSNTFQAAFQYDDVHYFVNNPAAKDLRLLIEGINGSRFMLFLTFWLDFKIAGLSPWIYHLTSILIHVFSSITAFLLLESLLNIGLRDVHRQYHTWVALFGALLFGLHPVQTMAVTYLSQRMASMAGLFYMLSVHFYLKARQSGKRTSYGASLLFCVLAMKTKEMAFTLPFMVFLTEYAFFRGKRKRPFAVMALFALSVAIIPLSDLEVHWGERAGDPEWKTLGTDVYTRGQYFATQMRVIMTYLRLLVLPVAQNIDYDYRVSGSILDPDAFLAALVHAGLIAAAIFLLRKGGRLMLAGFGILWFYIALSVESSVVPIAEIIAEYRLYLPSFGAVLTLSALTVSFFNLRRRGIWLAAFGALALVSFGAATFSRNFVWASERSLWTDAVKKSPNRMRPWINYAGTLGAAERVKIYEWVLSRDPGNRDALDFLAQAYIEMGMLDEAREILLGSERIGRRAENMSYLANYYIKRNENAEALFYLRKIMEMEPGDSGHHYRAGVALRGLGRVDEAEKAFREALRLDPSNVDALNDLGNLLAEKGRLGQSLEFLEKAARLKPGAASVWTNLGVTYAQMNDYDEALRALDKAITLNPKLPDPWFNKGVILWGAGRREAAVFALRKALSIDPNYQKARDQLRQWEGG